MNNIVVGIDFSTSSIHAFNYAKMLSKKSNSTIYLVWVDSFSVADTMISKNNEIRAEAKLKMEELINDHKSDSTIKELKFKLLKGKVAEELTRYAKKKEADCIIIGSHGITGYEEYWIGSNANRIIIYSHCPVITVRCDYNFGQSIQAILLPIDNTSETLNKISFTCDIAKMFDAKVTILGIYSTTLKSMHRKVDNLVKIAESRLNEKDLKCSVDYITVDNIAENIMNYLQKYPNNLVSIMSERESATKNVLLGEYAHKIVNHSPIPVLSIR